jgi:hypothetical protein
MQVYDCRSVTQDALNLMQASGVCTFCGDPIAVAVEACGRVPACAVHDGTAAAPTPPLSAAAATTSTGLLSCVATGASQRAWEYKDRMLEFDRTSSKRTAVIDDQGDYYEIEGNAWLTAEERGEMKMRQVLEDRVREHRRSRLVVSVDVIGRRVCATCGTVCTLLQEVALEQSSMHC